jgi:hypothetical protein
VVAHLPGQPYDQIAVGSRPNQRSRLDGLEVAGTAGRRDRGRGRWVRAADLRLQVVQLVGVQVVDDPAGLTLDLAHDGVNLDRAGQMVDEVDQHPDAGQTEERRPGQEEHQD